MGRFAGKRILVTGATRGIGHAVALLLLEEGASVILHGSTLDAVNRAIEPLLAIHGSRITGEAADLGDRAQCRSMGRRVTDVDVLINCAGLPESRSLADVDSGHWHRIMDINTTAPWILARELLPHLRARRGAIVNVSSDAGLLGYADHSVYCASKGALIGLTRALAVELAPDVRVLCVCPGPVDTGMMQETARASPEPEAAQASRRSLTLLGRVASPNEIAAAIAFAASEECSFAAGNLIVVDGGATAGRRV